MSAKTVQRRLESAIPAIKGAGNGTWKCPFSLVDPERAMAYIAKGRHSPQQRTPWAVFSSCAWDFDWAAYHEKYWAENVKNGEKRTRGLGARTASIAKRALAHFADKDTHVDDVTDWICTTLVNDGMGINVHHVRSARNAVMFNTGHKRRVIDHINND